MKRHSPKTARPALHWFRIARIVLVLGLIAYGVYTAQQRPRPQPPGDEPVVAEREEGSPEQDRVVVENVAVTYQDGGRIVTWRGDVDLTETIARIRRGERLEWWENDGDHFGNFEGRLPKRERGYYREWVHLTPQAPGPGPQRIVSGKDGDLWYTPDHYESFIELEEVATTRPSN